MKQLQGLILTYKREREREGKRGGRKDC